MTKNDVTGINKHQSATNQFGMPFIRSKYPLMILRVTR
jgi:hypothetical protein